MGKPHNWEETDNLLEKLRAKINEDTSEPAEHGAAEKKPVSGDTAPEPTAESPSAGKKKRHGRIRGGVAGAQESAPGAPSFAETPTDVARNTPEHRQPAAGQGTPAPEKEPDEADTVANLTVESLVKDIFGAAKNAGKEAEESASKKEEEPLPEEASEEEAPETVAGGSVPVASGAEKGGEMPVKEPANGQKAFSGVPDGKREETVSGAEEKNDLFAAFSIEESAGAPKASPAKRREADNTAGETVESSEENLKLLLDLDYEEELGNAIGFDRIREYRELGMNGAPVSARRGKRRPAERREYELPGQEKGIRREYLRRRKGHILRFAFTVLILLLLFFYEHPAWMPLLFRGPLDGAAFPRSYILLGLQLLLIDAALCYRHLKEGLVSFFRLSPVDYSLCSVALLVTALYHVVLLFLPADGVPTLYLSPAAAGLTLMSLADLFDWYREFAAFRVVSSKRQKYALIPRVSVGGRQNNAKERLMESEQDDTVLYARPVGFVRNYFANTERREEYNKTLGTRLLPVLAVGLACGLYTVAANKGGTVFQVLLITFFLCLPCISLLVTSLPMFLASLLRLGKDGAIIGEEPVYSCGEKTTLVMPADEIFEKMTHEQFELVEHCDIQHTLVLVRALLEKIQSPLVASVDVDEEMRVPPEAVELLEVEEEGVSAIVGAEKTPVLLGSMTYLQAHGIGVQPRAGTGENDLRRMLLVTVDGKVCAIFLARYRFGKNVEEFLSDLREEDVRMMVRTRDPGVREDLFRSLQPDVKDPVQVMKPTAKEMDIRTDRVDATVVALDSCMAVGETFLICRRIRRAGLFGRRLQILSMVVGAMLAMVLSFFGKLQVFTPTLLTVYIFFWSAVDAVASYLYLRDKENL